MGSASKIVGRPCSSLAEVTSFNLDEYVGLSPDYPGSYHRVMAEALVSRTDLRAEAVHLPRGDAPDPEAEARAYEARIAAAKSADQIWTVCP